MTKTIAMTGATGFAGRHALEALLDKGYRVKALVRNPQAAILPPGVTAVAGDLAHPAALTELVKDADTVLHLAGAIAAVDRAQFFDVNARGTAALAHAAAHAGVTRFVHVSSLAARQPELSDYGASKRAGEAAVTQPGLPFRTLILRPPAVYGPGDRATLPLLRELTRPVAVIPSLPRARFSLIHVSDLAAILAEAVDDPRDGLIEVSDGREAGYAWPELIAIAEAEAGRRIRPVFLPFLLPHLVGRVAGALSRLRSRPGMVTAGKIAELYHPDWVARGAGWPLASFITFETGFAATLKWYRDRGWLPPARGMARSGTHAKRETHR
jgi:nucleoside-diphosphate-sugar epimerase